MRRVLKLGRILSVDSKNGIIHVQTYREEKDEQVTDVGHIPIVFSSFLKSVQAILTKGAPPSPLSLEGFVKWKFLYESGKAGAFTLKIREIEKEAYLIGSKSGQPRPAYLFSVYPTLGRDNLFSKITVEAVS